jgi:hypothetical protein
MYALRTDETGYSNGVIRLPVRLAAITSRPRYAVVSELTATLNDLGWILDHHQFSNMALNVAFEIPSSSIRKLRVALVGLPIHLSGQSLEAITALEDASASALPDLIAGSIHVSFIHSEPDLRVPVPAVPG